MSLEKIDVKRRKIGTKAWKHSSSQEEGIETTNVVFAIPSISNDGTGPYSDGEVHAKVRVKDPNDITSPVDFWVKQSVSDIYGLDDS